MTERFEVSRYARESLGEWGLVVAMRAGQICWDGDGRMFWAAESPVMRWRVQALSGSIKPIAVSGWDGLDD